MRRATALAVPVRMLSLSIYSHFYSVGYTLYVCLAAENRKSTKHSILGV